MAERLGSVLRRIDMRTGLLGVAIALPLLLAGCGDAGGTPPGSAASASPSGTVDACVRESGGTGPRATVDLDGDDAPDSVEFVAFADCPDGLEAEVGDQHPVAALAGDLPVTADDMVAVQVPGRTGQVLLVRQRHPRGGFQARLFGYADGRFEELTVAGQPVFGFIATDVTTTPTAARCVADGFEITQAKAHEPIGVLPAWDVFRTTYAVDGNTVTRGATTEIADNVLDDQLQRQYGDLVGYELFGNCLASR
jgi:hypothetical protein